ncbi:pentapeptide repeat-containing protein [Nonomuraea sp. NPDC048901]|uniref:pentapeptide repeat-containing protein n=1 Tax=Nonomuraea sp. NPDC048901 TaxID=3155627 RepID=UPI00340B5319
MIFNQLDKPLLHGSWSATDFFSYRPTMTSQDESTLRLPPPAQTADVSPTRKPQAKVTRTFRNLARPKPALESPTPPPEVRPKRRRRPRVTPPTQEELDRLPIEKRQEMYDARRQRPWQHLTSIGVLLGLIFTGGGLVYTARTYDTGQETLRTTQQQQITDRYTKAVESIGKDKPMEVRVGGLYALARVAKDSPPDASTIEQVVTVYTLEHDREDLERSQDIREPRTITPWHTGVDLVAALKVLRQVHLVDNGSLGLRSPLRTARFMGAVWNGMDLSEAMLSEADLTGANLTSANLISADLTDANISRVNATNVWLIDANLTGATFYAADLTSAAFSDANLTGTDLTNAILADADLSGAVLTNATLTGADLRGADLRGVRGVTPDKIRKQARTDATTQF